MCSATVSAPLRQGWPSGRYHAAGKHPSLWETLRRRHNPCGVAGHGKSILAPRMGGCSLDAEVLPGGQAVPCRARLQGRDELPRQQGLRGAGAAAGKGERPARGGGTALSTLTYAVCLLPLPAIFNINHLLSPSGRGKTPSFSWRL